MRLGIVTLTVPFAVPYYASAMEQVPRLHRLSGMATSAVFLWLYQTLGWGWPPGLYLMVVGTAAAGVIYGCAIEKRRVECVKNAHIHVRLE